jgi:predicted dehydrogenase
MISLGIIGAGIMGERMLRAALDQAPDVVRVAAIWDPSQAALARIGAAAPHAASAEALIAGADCVYIASPPASHLPHAQAALAAGKAAFCEKPLAVDVPAANAFLAAHPNARAAVNFPMASSLAVATLREWLPGIGTPLRLEIETSFRIWPRPWQADASAWLDRPQQGGFTREVVSHFLFLTRRLCGPMVLEQAHAGFHTEGASERAIAARITAGGLPVTLPVSLWGGVGTTLKDDHNTWTLWGEAGAIRLRDWSVAEKLANGAWIPDPEAMPNERMRPLVLRRQLEAVARLTRGEPHHLATLQEALDVQAIVEGILAA